MTNQFKKTNPIKQVALANCLQLDELHDLLKSWLLDEPNAFRLDGHNAIGPANPTQHIFFKVEKIPPGSFSGTEEGSLVDGSAWNGTYFLTASCRRVAVEQFVNLYSKYSKDLGKVFSLGYTPGKEGQPKKRRLYLKSSDEVNSGWNCKQYIPRYSSRY